MNTIKPITAVLLFITLSCTIDCETQSKKNKEIPLITTVQKNSILEVAPLQKNGSTTIWIQDRQQNAQYWTNLLNEFLGPYRTPSPGNNTVHECGNEPPPKGGICDVETRVFQKCNPDFNYGYVTASPCVFLRLKNLPKVWVPQLYNTSNVPGEMPRHLKERLWQEEDRKVHNKVWVSCEGEQPPDQEYMGPITYYPESAFPANYFHVADTNNFLSPLVAVQFERPRYGIIINVVCTAWAANIPRGTEEKTGTVHFQLLLD